MGRVASEALALVWRGRIARQRRSQLSVAEFCGQEGVSSKSFYVWRKRLRAASAGQADMADPCSGCPASELFVPVTLPLAGHPCHGSPAAGGLRIESPSGVVLTLPADAPAELVTTAIRVALSSAWTAERPSC